jgi:hypothetical protein
MGLISFVCASPVASWTPTCNPVYGDGLARVTRCHQPRIFCGADLYSYNHGRSGSISLGWNRLPATDKDNLIAFFDAIYGQATKFVFTDRDAETYTAQLVGDSLTWREVEPGYYNIQMDLDLS